MPVWRYFYMVQSHYAGRLNRDFRVVFQRFVIVVTLTRRGRNPPERGNRRDAEKHADRLLGAIRTPPARHEDQAARRAGVGWAPRTRAPGRAPVWSPSRATSTPETNVCR